MEVSGSSVEASVRLLEAGNGATCKSKNPNPHAGPTSGSFAEAARKLLGSYRPLRALWDAPVGDSDHSDFGWSLPLLPPGVCRYACSEDDHNSSNPQEHKATVGIPARPGGHGGRVTPALGPVSALSL